MQVLKKLSQQASLFAAYNRRGKADYNLSNSPAACRHHVTVRKTSVAWFDQCSAKSHIALQWLAYVRKQDQEHTLHVKAMQYPCPAMKYMLDHLPDGQSASDPCPRLLES